MFTSPQNNVIMFCEADISNWHTDLPHFRKIDWSSVDTNIPLAFYNNNLQFLTKK